MNYPIATSLLTEFTPRKSPGTLISFLIVMLSVGAGLASFVGELAISLAGEDGWRWTLASAALPAVRIVLMQRGTPESPRWLVAKGRTDEALRVVQQAFGPHVTVEDITPTDDRGKHTRDLLRYGYLGRMVFVTVFWTASLVPVYALYAFGPTILGTLGLAGASVTYGSAAINAIFLIGCILAMLLINRLGRRQLLIWSFPLSGVALLALGISPTASAALVLTFFAAYAIFIGGAQVLQFAYPNELFPTKVRASAVGLASSLSRTGAAIGVYLVPIALEAWGAGPTMIVAAALTFIRAIYSVVAAPDTRGRSLQEASSLTGWPRRTMPKISTTGTTYNTGSTGPATARGSATPEPLTASRLPTCGGRGA